MSAPAQKPTPAPAALPASTETPAGVVFEIKGLTQACVRCPTALSSQMKVTGSAASVLFEEGEFQVDLIFTDAHGEPLTLRFADAGLVHMVDRALRQSAAGMQHWLLRGSALSPAVSGKNSSPPRLGRSSLPRKPDAGTTPAPAGGISPPKIQSITRAGKTAPVKISP